jgi:hypothetical protein
MGEKSRLSTQLNGKVLSKRAQSNLTLENETNLFFLKETLFSNFMTETSGRTLY